MLERDAIGWIRERDVDLLLSSELQQAGALRHLLEKRLGYCGFLFEGAWVSHAEIDGESDLVISWQSERGRSVALVENKIAAAFQPEQGVRYTARAAKWATLPDVFAVRTILLAPSDYLERPGSEPFDLRIGYEEIAEALRSTEDARSLFLAQTLQAGIANYRRGYVAVPDQNVSLAWYTVWMIAQAEAPTLNMQPPGDKPGKSTWIYLREATGLAPDRGQVVLVYKMERGQADLQFSGTLASALASATSGILEPGMSIAPAKKSASVRLTVPVLDFAAEIEGQTENIRFGLAACDRLRAFFVVNRARLLS